MKSGGAIEPQGTRITLRITDPSDMTRDILKVRCLWVPALPWGGAQWPHRAHRVLPLQSETCSVEIPELEFELGMGALGGKFTTLEGLLKDIRDLVSGAGGLSPSGGLGSHAALSVPALPGGEEPLHPGGQLYTQQDREAAGVHWEAAGGEGTPEFPCFTQPLLLFNGRQCQECLEHAGNVLVPGVKG